MKFFKFFTILAFSYIPSILGDLAHSIVYKSFPTALQECAEYLEASNCALQWISEDSYPKVDEIHRLIHCTLVNLGAWDHGTNQVRSHVLQNFFQPAPGDCCYQNRTLQCLKKISTSDHYERMYESFQCYNQNYGNLLDTDQYIPFEQNELFQIIETGLTLLTLPRCTLEEYSKGNILDDPHFARSLLICTIRGGYYSIQGGLNTHALYVQFANQELLTAETRQCCDAVVKQESASDHATKLYRIFKNCLMDTMPTLKLFQSVAYGIVNKCLK